jgi:Holliday junction resolvase RusA-like endonuclease
MKNFTLTGCIVPKARARVTRNGTYHPHRYQHWKRDAITSLTLQAVELGLNEPLSGVAIKIQLVGKHSRRGDLDNIAGSVLDALVQAGILKDDSLSVVSGLAIALQWSKEPPIVRIRIEPISQQVAA